MKKEEIHLGDLQRWLFGQAPAEFMWEVLIRTVLIYLILLLAVYLLGKRMTSQLTITEFSVMITLGAIVSPAMQLPDRGLMFGAAGLLVAVCFQRGINLWAFKSEKIEHLTQGKMVTLVKDGMLVLDEMTSSHITRQQVFALLRQENVFNLGKVKRAYLESCGALSIFEEAVPKAGLPIFPAQDDIVRHHQKEASPITLACTSCGNVVESAAERPICNICQSGNWIHAHIDK